MRTQTLMRLIVTGTPVGINEGNEGEPHIELADDKARWPQFGNLWTQQPTMLIELKMTS